ncbi:hypothetical protein BVIET440_120044 [Burkholderia vietnamiensis]
MSGWHARVRCSPSPRFRQTRSLGVAGSAAANISRACFASTSTRPRSNIGEHMRMRVWTCVQWSVMARGTRQDFFRAVTVSAADANEAHGTDAISPARGCSYQSVGHARRSIGEYRNLCTGNGPFEPGGSHAE